MTISLSPKFEQLIQEKIASGAYASADEVVGKALRLLNEHDAETPEWKRRFRQGRRGLASPAARRRHRR